MSKKSFTVSMLLGLAFANGVFAADPKTEKDELVINSVTYIEDDASFKLGFNTADYLPEGFNPYEVYFDLDAIIFVEEEASIKVNSRKYLPKGFDAYAYPRDVEGFNYIDTNDDVEVDFDTAKHLPKGFNPYKK